MYLHQNDRHSQHCVESLWLLIQGSTKSKLGESNTPVVSSDDKLYTFVCVNIHYPGDCIKDERNFREPISV